VRWIKARDIISTWIITIPGAAIIAAFIYLVPGQLLIMTTGG